MIQNHYKTIIDNNYNHPQGFFHYRQQVKETKCP